MTEHDSNIRGLYLATNNTKKPYNRQDDPVWLVVMDEVLVNLQEKIKQSDTVSIKELENQHKLGFTGVVNVLSELRDKGRLDYFFIEGDSVNFGIYE